MPVIHFYNVHDGRYFASQPVNVQVLKIAFSSHRAAVGMRALQLLARAKTQNFSGAAAGAACGNSPSHHFHLQPPPSGLAWPGKPLLQGAVAGPGPGLHVRQITAHALRPHTPHHWHTVAYTMARYCRVQHIDPCSTLS